MAYVVCGVLFFFFRGRHGHKQDRRKHGVCIMFWVACFTVVVGHCRFHSSGVCLFQQSSRLTQPGEDAHCVCPASNWTERNAAMTQKQHLDQGEIVDGRGAKLGHRKITVRCRDTFWRDERHQQVYVEFLGTHATLLPTITSRVGQTVMRGPCTEALEQRWPQRQGTPKRALTSSSFLRPGSSFQHLVCARSNAGRGAARRRTEACLVTSGTTHRWHMVHVRDRHKGLQDPKVGQ